MNQIIEEHRESLESLCRRFRVRRLELFGSATGNDFDPDSSDLDFLVDFADLASGEYADSYFGLLEALESLFGRHVDLVMPGAIENPYFLKSVNETRTILYAA